MSDPRPSTGTATRADEPIVIVRPTPDAASAVAADLITGALADAIAQRGVGHFVTTGGSTPYAIYRAMASTLRDRVDWSRVHFWWGDDRFVPRDHPLSNVQAADAILFGISEYAGQSGNRLEGIDIQEGFEQGITVPVENIHPFPCTEAIAGSHGPEWCASRYADTIHAAGLPDARGFPAFDVILAGIGSDGHLLSVFPGSAAFDSQDVTLGIPAPTHIEPHVPRVTMNPAVLGVARMALAVATGASKASIVGRIFTSPRDVRELPAQLVRRRGATWVLDTAAAADVPPALTSA